MTGLKTLIEKALEKSSEPKFTIGIDTHDKDVHAYCLVKNGDAFNVIMAKEMRAGAPFEEEVNNLAKYFNASIFNENGEIERPFKYNPS